MSAPIFAIVLVLASSASPSFAQMAAGSAPAGAAVAGPRGPAPPAYQPPRPTPLPSPHPPQGGPPHAGPPPPPPHGGPSHGEPPPPHRPPPPGQIGIGGLGIADFPSTRMAVPGQFITVPPAIPIYDGSPVVIVTPEIDEQVRLPLTRQERIELCDRRWDIRLREQSTGGMAHFMFIDRCLAGEL